MIDYHNRLDIFTNHSKEVPRSLTYNNISHLAFITKYNWTINDLFSLAVQSLQTRESVSRTFFHEFKRRRNHWCIQVNNTEALNGACQIKSKPSRRCKVVCWSTASQFLDKTRRPLGVNSGNLGFCAYSKIRNAMRMYHCEVRPTFSLRSSRRFSLRFTQTIELHPECSNSHILHSI